MVEKKEVQSRSRIVRVEEEEKEEEKIVFVLHDFRNLCLFLLPLFVLILLNPEIASACSSKIKRRVMDNTVNLPTVLKVIQTEFTPVVDFRKDMISNLCTNTNFTHLKNVKPFLYEFNKVNWSHTQKLFPKQIPMGITNTIKKRGFHFEKLEKALKLRGGEFFSTTYLTAQAFQFIKKKVEEYIRKKMDTDNQKQGDTPQKIPSLNPKTNPGVSISVLLAMLGYFFRDKLKKKAEEAAEIIIPQTVKRRKYSYQKYFEDIAIWGKNNPLFVIFIIAFFFSIIPVLKYLKSEVSKTEVGGHVFEFLEKQNQFAKKIISDRVQDIKVLTNQLLQQAGGINSELSQRLQQEESRTDKFSSRNEKLQKELVEKNTLLNSCEMKSANAEKMLKDQSGYLLNENQRASNQKIQIKNAQTSLQDFLTQNPNVCPGLGKERVLDYVDRKVFPEPQVVTKSGLIVDYNDPQSVNKAFQLDKAKEHASSEIQNPVLHQVTDDVFHTVKRETETITSEKEKPYQAVGFEVEQKSEKKNVLLTQDQISEYQYLNYKKEKALQSDAMFGAKDKQLVQVYKRCVSKNSRNPELQLDCKNYEHINPYDFSEIPDIE